MDIKEQLNTLRQDVEGCALVAFADIEAGLVLVSSSADRAPREELDALCAEAAALFKVADDGSASGGLQGSDIALTHSAEHLKLFVRDSVGGTDVLCAVLTSGARVDRLIAETQATADRLFDQSGAA